MYVEYVHFVRKAVKNYGNEGIHSHIKNLSRTSRFWFEPNFTRDTFAVRVYKGKGCDFCNHTGYKGRVAIYEVLEISPKIKEINIITLMKRPESLKKMYFKMTHQ